MSEDRIIVVGAGIGGLSAAIDLASRGHKVTLVEQSAVAGGKMRQVDVGGALIDSGPTVFTMRDVFDDLFDRAGARLEDYVTLKPLEVLARHGWSGGQTLDLFADRARSADAIGNFAGAKAAAGYRRFCERAQRTYQALDQSFMRAPKPNPISLTARLSLADRWALMRVTPFMSMWQELGTSFSDPRLRQLFGRYATYCGGSPFLSPAILILIAHAEQNGVYALDGGMWTLAEGLVALATRLGIEFRFGAKVAQVTTHSGAVSGVSLANGEKINGSAVILNVDPQAIAEGLLGPSIAPVAGSLRPKARSLSAITFSMMAEVQGFALDHHTVFFSDDYRAEFADLDNGRRPADPTTYVYAQDRSPFATPSSGDGIGAERLFCLTNAPARGGDGPLSPAEIDQCKDRMMARFQACGLKVTPVTDAVVVTQPSDFHRLFPGSHGALYGRAPHGWLASFQRPGARTKMPGLYLAGGAAHPGAGVPMAALSGRLAAAALSADLASIARSRKTAMSGGMLMAGAKTDSTH